MIYQDNASLQNPKLGSRVGPKTYDKIRFKKKKKKAFRKKKKRKEKQDTRLVNILCIIGAFEYCLFC